MDPLLSSSAWWRLLRWAIPATVGSVAIFVPALAAQTEWDMRVWNGRAGHALAFDSVRGKAVLFGGSRHSLLRGVPYSTLSDTWEWDGTVWNPRNPTTVPFSRSGHALAFDSARGKTVLFGGNSGGSSTCLNDTWEWDGIAWSLRFIANGPTCRRGHALAYDSARGVMVVFGGISHPSRGNGEPLSDTWEYGPVNPARYSAFGHGCQGTAGVPALAAATGQLPWIGGTFSLRLTGIPNNAPAVVCFGASRTVWPPLALPFPLDPLGMAGCVLFASGEFLATMPTCGNAGALSVVLPNDSGLLGGEFFNQALIVDLVANAAGLTASNAAEATIGAR